MKEKISKRHWINFSLRGRIFESLGHETFIGFNSHKMIVMCEKTYDQLCRQRVLSEAHRELRRKLLGMSRMNFRLGAGSVEEFSTLGNEVAEIIRGGE